MSLVPARNWISPAAWRASRRAKARRASEGEGASAGTAPSLACRSPGFRRSRDESVVIAILLPATRKVLGGVPRDNQSAKLFSLIRFKFSNASE